MIISKDINPKRDLYYIGSLILEILSSNKEKISFDFFETFKELKSKEEVSIGLYTLSLDWLYLIGALRNGEKGNIIKCF